MANELILIVEDNPKNLNMERNALQIKGGSRITVCPHGMRGDVMSDRRKFIAKAGVVVAAAAAGGAHNVIAQPRIHWRMSTTWAPANDLLQGAALRLAKVVEEASGGRFQNYLSSLAPRYAWPKKREEASNGRSRLADQFSVGPGQPRTAMRSDRSAVTVTRRVGF